MNETQTYAQRQENVIGYMDNGGRVFCVDCTNQGEPMLAHMLASRSDECDGCHVRLITGKSEALHAEYVGRIEGAA